jgi:hypothetical protein
MRMTTSAGANTTARGAEQRPPEMRGAVGISAAYAHGTRVAVAPQSRTTVDLTMPAIDSKLVRTHLRVEQWMRAHRAAIEAPRQVTRSYDVRYARPEMTHERATAEALAAAALAREYTR